MTFFLNTRKELGHEQCNTVSNWSCLELTIIGQDRKSRKKDPRTQIFLIIDQYFYFDEKMSLKANFPTQLLLVKE